jgi:hypothetical protein
MKKTIAFFFVKSKISRIFAVKLQPLLGLTGFDSG